MPKQPLSDEEIKGLIQMREEEKLARDVYLTLYDIYIWKLPIFKNIANSEQSHTDAVKVLLEKYGLEDLVKSDKMGEFTSNEMRKLYEELVKEEMKSLLDALIAEELLLPDKGQWKRLQPAVHNSRGVQEDHLNADRKGELVSSLFLFTSTLSSSLSLQGASSPSSRHSWGSGC